MAVEDYVSAKESARILGITVSSVHELFKRSTLPYQWLAGRKVTKRAAVLKLRDDPEYQLRSRKGCHS